VFKTRLEGRLGNQLFIYAFSRELVEKYGEKVLIYDRKNEKDLRWHSRLDHYNLSKDISFTSDALKFYKMRPNTFSLFLLNRLKSKKLTPRQLHNFQLNNMSFFYRNRLFALQDGYMELPNEIKDQTLFLGYFQSPKYFNNIKDKLIKELKPIHKYSNKEIKFIEDITGSESVCVTIRLGDYLNNSVHQVCTSRFYNEAMKRMKELIPNCKFFIFSDDIEGVKKLIHFDYPVVYDTTRMADYVSLDAMSKCKNFIISNSSFSWWAQYLSQNENKIVIAPNKWYAIDVPCDIYEPNWLILNAKTGEQE